MQKVFRTKGEAAAYYDRFNPHMPAEPARDALRRLSAHNTWASDWDPVRHLMYIVRRDCGIRQSVPPFEPIGNPSFERLRGQPQQGPRYLMPGEPGYGEEADATC